MTGPAGGVRSTFFVVLEQGRYRIVATDSNLGEIGTQVLNRLNKGDLPGARRWLDWAREERSPLGGNDPFVGSRFGSFWEKDSKKGPDQIRYAAASLIAETAAADRAIPILQEGRQRAVSDQVRLNFDLALAGAFARLERPADLLPIAGRLVEVSPDSPTAFFYLAASLRGQHQQHELKRAAEEHLKRLPEDQHALRILAEIAAHQGDFEQAQHLHERLVELGKAEAVDFNNAAWRTLFEGPLTDQAIEYAERAALLSANLDSYALHTLASLYAEIGKPGEAREVILQSMEVRGSEEPQPEDWYVFGRIYEQYGELDAATAAYRKLKPPENEEHSADSTYRLAQRRLTLLEASKTEETRKTLETKK